MVRRWIADNDDGDGDDGLFSFRGVNIRLKLDILTFNEGETRSDKDVGWRWQCSSKTVKSCLCLMITSAPQTLGSIIWGDSP